MLNNRLRWCFWGILALQIALAAAEALSILVIAFFTLTVSAPEKAMHNGVVQELLSLSPSLREVCQSTQNFIIFVSILMVVFIIIKNAITVTVLYCSHLFAENVSLIIVRETIRRFLAKDYFWHLSPESKDVLFRMSNRSQLSIMNVQLLQLYSNIICTLALFASLFLAEPGLTLFVVCIFSLVASITSVELVLFAFLNGRQGDICVKKAPAATIATLAHALSDIFNANKEPVVIGTRHGEKKHECLINREEMVRAEDLDGYYCIRSDARDLNYTKYFAKGEHSISEKQEYTSENTQRLAFAEMRKILLDLDYVKEALTGTNNAEEH